MYFKTRFAQWVLPSSDPLRMNWYLACSLCFSENFSHVSRQCDIFVNLQQWANCWTCRDWGCVKFLPGPAWLLLSETGPSFSGSMCSMYNTTGRLFNTLQYNLCSITAVHCQTHIIRMSRLMAWSAGTWKYYIFVKLRHQTLRFSFGWVNPIERTTRPATPQRPMITDQS